jgi:indolepyruvate decarboxylase
MAAEITAAQADLRAATAPEEIDRVLSTALRTSRPVYLTIPADVADLPVLAPAEPLPRASQEPDPGGRPVVIEVALGADDAPPLLRELTRALAAPASG